MKKTGLLVVMFTLILSLFVPTLEANAASQFKDVKSNFWAADQIKRYAEKGVVKGYGDGTFRPDKAVSRGEAAVMLARALDLDTNNVKDVPYKDIDRKHPYYKEIAAVTQEGIMNGLPGDKFDSDGNLQRAHMAIMLAKAFDLETDQKANFKDVADNFYAAKEINAIYAHGVTTGFEDKTFRPTEATTRAQFVTFLDRVLAEDHTDLLKEIYKKELTLESYEFEGSAKIGLTLPESFFEVPDLEDFEIDPELLEELGPEFEDIEIPEFTEEDLAELEQQLEMLRQLLSNIEVTLKGSYQLDPMMMEADVTVNIPGDIGINLNLPMIMTDTKMWIKFPDNHPLFPMPEEIAGKYVEFDLEALADFDELGGEVPPMNFDMELQTQLAVAIYDLVFDHFGKDFYWEVSKDAINIPNGLEVDKVLKFELTNHSLQKFVEILFTGFIPEFIDLIVEDPELAEALGFTPEMIEEMDFVLEEMTALFDEMAGSLNEFINIKTFEEYIAINADKYIVYDLMNIDVDINFAGETFGLKLNSDASKTNINGDIEFKYGIPSPENVISFEELLELELEDEAA